MRQYLWLFENITRIGVEDFLILSGKAPAHHSCHRSRHAVMLQAAPALQSVNIILYLLR